MPCNSDHMNASTFERDISRVACLLDEYNGVPYTPSHWNGYHPRVYGKVTKPLADQLVAELCGKLKDADVSAYSLEMQMWWRDHQKADIERLARELPEDSSDDDMIPLAQPRTKQFSTGVIPVTGIEAKVCADIARRQQMGIKKYGTQLADNPAGEIERLRHAYEEALDLAIYLKWHMDRLEGDL